MPQGPPNLSSNLSPFLGDNALVYRMLPLPQDYPIRFAKVCKVYKYGKISNFHIVSSYHSQKAWKNYRICKPLIEQEE
ncbi:hypothetical protein RIR_jg31861.t1 [Rhizophagus irregularis DAOM 181602=DAOM 197198]|nr:hypothetical protein RIR_jg31861.t1 [Rhizophagus irregularis DAOM 181602=DAOM 197198]